MRMGSAAAASRVAGLLLTALALAPAGSAAGAGKALQSSSDYGKLPLSFEENRGQTDSRVKYISRGAGYTLFLTPTDTVLSLTGVDRQRKSITTSLRMTFAGGREASLSGVDVQPGRSSYFMGSDPSGWRTGLRNFGRVSYKGIYPGIDAVFYGNQRQMEYDFIVAPGADPKQIRLKFDGVEKVVPAPNGDLVLRTALGDVRQLRPVIYQEIDGKRRIIDGRYRVSGNEATFDIAAYDARKPLVIDPVMAWSRFLGGTGSDTVAAIAVDAESNAIVAGYTASNDFNAAIRFIGVSRGGASDAFITKFGSANTVIWSAFYGGQGMDEALGVAVDGEGSIYVTGRTDTPVVNGAGFPLVSPLQDALGGATDAFIAKIAADGSRLLLSTYVGGFGEDVGNAIAVDAELQPVIAGTTASTNFWALNGPFRAYAGGSSDAFALKLRATGGGVVWSSYLGGGAADTAYGVAVDSTGASYITGSTRSFSFPRTTGVVQPAIGSQNISGTFAEDGYVTKITTTGGLVYSTFLGGSGFDIGMAIAVDGEGNAYVFGDTESGNFPTANAYQGTHRGNRDTFVTKLNPTATARVYSTFLGGTGSDQAGGIAVREGVAHLVGATTSTDFPLAAFTQDVNRGSYDVFVTLLNADGNALSSSTYLGGSGIDVAKGVALDGSGNIYLGGYTESFNFPTLTPNGTPTTFVGVRDGFVTKLSNCVVTLLPARNGAPGALHSNASQTGTITVTGPDDCTWNASRSADWIAIVSASATAGNGQLTYAITANAGAARVGAINIAGVAFTIEQQAGSLGAGCVFPPTPPSAIAAGAGQQGTFTVGTLHNECAWTATPNVPWIQVFPPNGTSTTAVSYTVYPNFSSTVRSGTVTIAAQGVSQTFTVTQANTFQTEPQRFVSLLYFNYLGRYPSPAEVDFQTAVLAGGTSRGDLAASFFNAPEFLQGGRFVAGLYLGILNRDAEFGGWLFQRNALSVGVVNQDQLVANFINSQEFQLKYGALTNEQFVQLMYLQVLGRNASPDEVAFHAGFLNAGTMTRVQTARNFLNSDEFRIRLASRLSAFLLYATLLQRDASSAELNDRQIQLQAGTPISTLTTEFIASPEFLSKLQ